MDRLPEWLKKYVGAAEHAHWADCSSRDTYDWMYNAILAFLNAAEKGGWVMVPREANETMLESGRKAWKTKRLHVSHAASDEFMTCGVIYRAMLDAAKE